MYICDIVLQNYITFKIILLKIRNYVNALLAEYSVFIKCLFLWNIVIYVIKFISL